MAQGQGLTAGCEVPGAPPWEPIPSGSLLAHPSWGQWPLVMKKGLGPGSFCRAGRPLERVWHRGPSSVGQNLQEVVASPTLQPRGSERTQPWSLEAPAPRLALGGGSAHASVHLSQGHTRPGGSQPVLGIKAVWGTCCVQVRQALSVRGRSLSCPPSWCKYYCSAHPP